MHLINGGGASSTTAARPVVGIALPGGGAECAAQAGAVIYIAERMEAEHYNYVGGAGASGGGLNLGYMTQGWVEGKGAGVAHHEEKLWWSVGRQHPLHSFNQLCSVGTVDHSAGSRHNSLPQAPFGANPIEWMVAKQLDFDVLGASTTPTVLVSTVLPLEGREKVTRNPALTPQTFAASSALPGVFNSVNINGRPHWDGGVVGVPLDPLYRLHPQMTDLIIVPPLPQRVDHISRYDTENAAHMRSLMWNAPWQREIFQIMERSCYDPQRSAPLRVHLIDVSNETRNPLEFSWPSLKQRMDGGYSAAKAAWQEIGPNIGKASTYLPSYEHEGFPAAGNIQPQPPNRPNLRLAKLER